MTYPVAQLCCEHCGRIAYDVRPTIVEAEEGATVTVLGHEVPERFRYETRCVDHEACDDRASGIGVGEAS